MATRLRTSYGYCWPRRRSMPRSRLTGRHVRRDAWSVVVPVRHRGDQYLESAGVDHTEMVRSAAGHRPLVIAIEPRTSPSGINLLLIGAAPAMRVRGPRTVIHDFGTFAIRGRRVAERSALARPPRLSTRKRWIGCLILGRTSSGASPTGLSPRRQQGGTPYMPDDRRDADSVNGNGVKRG